MIKMEAVLAPPIKLKHKEEIPLRKLFFGVFALCCLLGVAAIILVSLSLASPATEAVFIAWIGVHSAWLLAITLRFEDRLDSIEKNIRDILNRLPPAP
jgi:hypothetical protein